VKLENWFNRFYADGKFLPQVWFFKYPRMFWSYRYCQIRKVSKSQGCTGVFLISILSEIVQKQLSKVE